MSRNLESGQEHEKPGKSAEFCQFEKVTLIGNFHLGELLKNNAKSNLKFKKENRKVNQPRDNIHSINSVDYFRHNSLPKISAIIKNVLT